MKIASLIFGLLLMIGGIDDIATINRLKKQAEQAYQHGDYEQAIQHYQVLVDSLLVEDDKIRLNLAHAYLQAGDTATAQRQYGQLMNADNTNIKSVAYQQLGSINTHQQQYKDALALFKESLKANPANEDSRYNYELVKKLQKEQEQQQQQDKSENNQDQSEEQQQDQQQNQNQDQQEGEQQSEEQQQQDQQGESTDESSSDEQQSDQERQEGEQQPSDAEEQNAQQGEEQSEGEKSDEEQSASPLSERLQEMNISEEKARMILEAMRNNEMQYIQQNRRKPTKPRDRSKPDW